VKCDSEVIINTQDLDLGPPVRFRTPGSKIPPRRSVKSVVCAEFHDIFMYLRSSLKVERHVFLGLPRLLLPLDGTQFIACLANLCSDNPSMWPAKRTRLSVTISCKRDDELLYRTSLFVLWLSADTSGGIHSFCVIFLVNDQFSPAYTAVGKTTDLYSRNFSALMIDNLLLLPCEAMRKHGTSHRPVSVRLSHSCIVSKRLKIFSTG